MIERIQDLRLITSRYENGEHLTQIDSIGDGITETFQIEETGMPETVEICLWQINSKGENIFQSNRSFEKHEVELMIDYLTSLYNRMK